MYKIGELSRLTKIPVKTLRFYDNEGILSPDRIDEFTGYRYYSASKISDCYRILALKEFGFTLEQIKAQLNISKSELIVKENELYELKAQTEKRIKNLQALYSSLENDNAVFNVVIRKSDDIHVAYARKILDNNNKINGLINEMIASLPGEIIESRYVVIDYDTEYGGELFDIGIGVEINGRLPKNELVEEKTIRFDSLTACLACTDESYENAIVFINNYIKENNYQIVGPVYKIIYKDKTIEIKIPVFPLKEPDYTPLREDISAPFENDEMAIGRWELVDTLACYEQFNHNKLTNKKGTKEIYFLPNGDNFWLYTWTKGYLIYHNNGQITKNRYTIKGIDGNTYMFIEMKLFYYTRCGGKPEIWVLKKLDSKEYEACEVKIKDKIPIEFINDTNVIGKWNAFDVSLNPDNYFKENDRYLEVDKLFWHSVNFIDNGLLINEFKGQVTGKIYTKDNFRWTNGCIMDIDESIVSKYMIKQFKSEDFLFIEWKSGDYKYGGKVSCYYVFKRGD